MSVVITRSQIAIAVATVLSAATMTAAMAQDSGAPKAKGVYSTGDFHNHTTCSDGSISMEKLIKKSTDKAETPWGLDWFVQAGHGGNGNRNCTLVEDASLSTPAYPFVQGKGPNTTWADSIGAAAVKGNTGSADGSSTTTLASQANPSMWRWQSVQEIQYPVAEYLSGRRNVPVFMGMESVVAGHEHTSMSVISGQVTGAKGAVGSNGYVPVGDATALAQWSYCFDRGDTDNSRGGANAWDCSVPNSDYSSASNPDWKPAAAKLFPAGGAGNGERGHLKTVEAMKWMAAYHPQESYYVPAHIERAGPFNPDGNNGFNIEHLRNFNNAAPMVAVGMETQPGHGASENRGEYSPDRNSIAGVRVDSVGGTTWGGTGVYGAQIGGVWDSLLGEGRNFWFFASSDWHNRGSFGPDDRRTTQDFYPGEYQRDFVMVRDTEGKAGALQSPQEIVDGIRSGNSWTASGQLVDRLTFIACTGARFKGAIGEAELEIQALKAAMNRTTWDHAATTNCATMGEKLKVSEGEDVVVAVAVRDPVGTNFSPYTFNNPSLAQIGKAQPLNKPELDHVDLIRGLVTGFKQPGAADYAGAWPDNWIDNPDMNTVPAAAKNPSAAVIRTFGAGKWKSQYGNGDPAFAGFKTMVYRIPAVQASQYVRLRGTNLPPATPFETDTSGNPLADIYTNASDESKLSIPCTAKLSTSIPADTVYTGTAIDGCPDHLARYPEVTGPQYVSYDVAAWADLWFYSNPIFIEVNGGQLVAGVK